MQYLSEKFVNFCLQALTNMGYILDAGGSSFDKGE